MKRRLLILESVLEKKVHPRDLHALAERVERQAPDIDVLVTGKRVGDHWKQFPHVFRPALTVAFGWLRNRRFRTGEILDCPRISKANELDRLRAAGVPVPDWVVLTPGTTLDPAVWGPYVVVKPTASSGGKEVRIRRTTRVRYAPPESFPEEHPGRKGPMLAQRFIYTGPWAVSLRICTFFGRALYCLRAEQSHEKRRLESRFEFKGGAGGGIQIIAPSRTSTYSLVDDREAIELAERAHQLAFPDYPYLGFDMLRDAESGRVSVLEVNSGGEVWHLSSRGGINLQRTHRINLYSQFGALEIAAERLVEVTRRRAMVAPMGRTSARSSGSSPAEQSKAITMFRSRIARAVLWLALVAGLAQPAAAQLADAATFLAEIGFDEDQIARVEAEEFVDVKIQPSTPREIVAAFAFLVSNAPADLADQLRAGLVGETDPNMIASESALPDGSGRREQEERRLKPPAGAPAAPPVSNPPPRLARR